MKKIYVFGNVDYKQDSIAINVANQLNGSIKNIEFVLHDTMLDFSPDEKDIIIMDAAMGIKKVELIEDLEMLAKKQYSSLHDYDIGFNLKLLKKIGKIASVKIIALPMMSTENEIIEDVKELIMSI